MNSVVDHAAHTAYSDPAPHADLVARLPTEPSELSAVARNVIVHYRASGHELPPESRKNINARWLGVILATDQRRHRGPLDADRPLPQRVQGCCRDHTLFCVGALRSHGIAARSRVGFAGYFVDGWHHDHVIAEAWLDGRWRRFDSEIDGPRAGLSTPMDIGDCDIDGPGFVTAAQIWSAWRDGGVDPDTYGVDPDMPILRGERFLFNEVIHEVAHRFGDELLLWDSWGRMGRHDEPVSSDDSDWLDSIAALVLASDSGDRDAELTLLDAYRDDTGLHPGSTVVQESPFGDPPLNVRLSSPQPANPHEGAHR